MPNYPVPCACGKTLDVPGTAAGSDVGCTCGRTVAVPSLARLKAEAGETVGSADFRIEQLLNANGLPLERRCVVCQEPTGHSIQVGVTCEQVEDANRPTRIMEVIATVFLAACFGWVAWLVYYLRGTERKVRGVDRRFSLPVRVCEDCEGTPRRNLLMLTPLYAELLEKYPRAVA